MKLLLLSFSGLTPVVVENVLDGDELRTNVAEIERQVERLGPDSVVAVMTTTSCFAPRGIDKLEAVKLLGFVGALVITV